MQMPLRFTTRRALIATSAALLLLCTLTAIAAGPVSDHWRQLQSTYLQASRAEHAARKAPWKTVASWDFADGQMPESFHVREGQWQVVDNALQAIAGEADSNRILSLGPCQWPAFRIELDVALHSRSPDEPTRIGDIGIRLNADPQNASFADGYAAILAQYGNQATVLYRLNIPLARTEFTPIVPGQRHRVVLEVVKPHLRLWVDDRIVLEAWERAGQNNRDHSDFLEMDPQKHLAIHTYDTRMVIHKIEIQAPVK